MEIKVGDKVRASKDAPMMYVGGIYAMFIDAESIVKVTEDDNAIIQAKNMSCLAIPLKYLVKVDAEAKEPKFKVGEKACYNGYVYEIEGLVGKNRYALKGLNFDLDEDMIEPYEPYTEPTTPTIKVGDRVCCYNVLHIKGSKKEDYMGYVASITDMGITIQLDKGGLVLVYHESDLELVQPKEQAEKKPNIGSITIPVEVDLTDSYWDTYTADLAHDLALKVANKYSDPKEAADYAVSVAKAVVENLKKK